MASDAYKYTEEFGGAVYKFNFVNKPFRYGDDVELRGDDLTDAQAEGDVEYAVDIARKHELERIELSKSAFMAWLKKSVQAQAKDVPEDERKAWSEGCTLFAKTMVKKIKELSFFCGTSSDLTASLAICLWNEDGMSGEFYLMKHMVNLVKY